MKEECSVTKNCRFLFWKYKSTKSAHDWVYIHEKERFCKKCLRKEILYDRGESWEDWRQGNFAIPEVY